MLAGGKREACPAMKRGTSKQSRSEKKSGTPRCSAREGGKTPFLHKKRKIIRIEKISASPRGWVGGREKKEGGEVLRFGDQAKRSSAPQRGGITKFTGSSPEEEGNIPMFYAKSGVGMGRVFSKKTGWEEDLL